MDGPRYSPFLAHPSDLATHELRCQEMPVTKASSKYFTSKDDPCLFIIIIIAKRCHQGDATALIVHKDTKEKAFDETLQVLFGFIVPVWTLSFIPVRAIVGFWQIHKPLDVTSVPLLGPCKL
ncbi:hypothetical protein WA026_009294 [Henosepilachna vigintioctopunctata]|uniref:Uncharacterized protein n=1 Tax=Henosepilachna vigintioctopunctata TaxID=420089 RepID=A0AAW1URB1_9CUCU